MLVQLGSEKIFYINVTCLFLPLREDADSLSCLRHGDTELDVDQRQMCDLVAGQWMWCMSLIIMTPYIFTFLKCLWRIVLKKCNTPDVTVILVVSFVVSTSNSHFEITILFSNFVFDYFVIKIYVYEHRLNKLQLLY